MNILDYKKSLLKAFLTSEKYVKSIGFSSVAEKIGEIRKSFEEKEIMIVTVGEMKRGKSMLQNALLGESVFPVDMNVCTNVVTVVRYGQKEQFEVVLEETKGDGFRYVSKKIKREDIPEYVSEQFNAANHKNVKLLNISLPNELLKDGVVFVDTPGVGSLNVSHAETTYGFLPNADLLLFVGDSTAPLTDTELNFLKKSYKYCKNIIYPLTKKDLNTKYAEIAADNKEKICRILEIAEDEVAVIPISSKAKIRYLENNSERMLEKSNFAELEKVIWSTIAEKRIEITVLPFVEAVKNELYSVADSITAQYQVLNTNKEKFNELQKELEEEIEKYKKFADDNSEWEKNLQKYLSEINSANAAAISNMFIDANHIVCDAIEQYGSKICDKDIYNSVYCNINEYISEALLDIKEDVMDKTSSIITDINNDLGLNVNSYENALDNMKFSANKNEISIKFPERKMSDKAIAGGRKVGMGMMGGSKAGAIVGGIFGVGLAILAGPAALAAAGATAVSVAIGGVTAGAAVGSVLGGIKGGKDAIENSHDVDIPYVKKELLNHITTTRTTITKVISDGCNNLSIEIKFDIKKQIKAKYTELEESIKRIKDMIKSNKPDDEKLEHLATEHRNVNNLIDAYTKSCENISDIELNAAETDKHIDRESETAEYSFI